MRKIKIIEEYLLKLNEDFTEEDISRQNVHGERYLTAEFKRQFMLEYGYDHIRVQYPIFTVTKDFTSYKNGIDRIGDTFAQISFERNISESKSN